MIIDFDTLDSLGGAVRATRATIDGMALAENFRFTRSRSEGCEVMAVVKADAYGHGAPEIARVLVQAGCSRFAVVTLEEGLALREAGLTAPVLLMGGVEDEAEANEAIARSLTPVLHDLRPLEWLRAAAGSTRAGVQIEVDSGMHRMGIPAGEAVALMQRVKETGCLDLEGVYTHLAQADEADLGPSLEQLQVFRAVLDEAQRNALAPALVHFANSAGLLAGSRLRERIPEANLVRPGLMLYGVSPAPHLKVELSPVMTLSTRVVQVRSVGRGRAVGYAGSYRPSRDTRVATLPLGYEDGVPVAASNRGSVCIRGRRFPIAGRVSMDYLGVDVGDAPVAAGDTAVIFGGRGDMALPVEEAAEAAGTIAYELLVRVGMRVPREEGTPSETDSRD